MGDCCFHESVKFVMNFRILLVFPLPQACRVPGIRRRLVRIYYYSMMARIVGQELIFSRLAWSVNLWQLKYSVSFKVEVFEVEFIFQDTLEVAVSPCIVTRHFKPYRKCSVSESSLHSGRFGCMQQVSGPQLLQHCAECREGLSCNDSTAAHNSRVYKRVLLIHNNTKGYPEMLLLDKTAV